MIKNHRKPIDYSAHSHSQGRYAEAELLYKRALAIDENALGPNHPDVATDLNNLAELYRDQGRYVEAEMLHLRALGIREKSLGPKHTDVADSINNLALLYQAQGRYAEAEHLYKRSLAITEKVLGPEHPDVAGSLDNLAKLYESQGRYTAAETLHKRALRIDEKALGSQHPSVAMSLNNLASLYYLQGRYTEVEPLLQRSLDIWEKTLGSEHPDVATNLNNLAVLYQTLGRFDEAEPLFRRSLAIWERALGPEHPSVAASLNNLALLYQAQGRYADTEPLFRRSLAMMEKAFGPDHPDVATSHNNLALLYEAQGNTRAALTHARKATAIHRNRTIEGAKTVSVGAISEQRQVRPLFRHHVALLAKATEASPEQRVAFTAEGFEVGQLALASSAGQALSRMAARFGAGDAGVAKLVRQRQDAVGQWQTTDAALVKAISALPGKRNAAREAVLRDTLARLDRELVSLDETLGRDFPEFRELASPKPLRLVDAQALLGPSEALAAYLVGKDESFLWVVRRDDAVMLRLELGRQALSDLVRRLRERLDPADIESIEDIRQFPLKSAYELYQSILAPAEALLIGVKHLMVVPDGALTSLPFAVLITDAPAGQAYNFSAYRNFAWLGKRFALTTLPSVSSLRALRRFAKGAPAPEPFRGFGAPDLEGDGAGQRGVDVTGLFTSGAIANVAAVRQLPALPDTAGELVSMARALGASTNTVYLGASATERAVKSADLSRYRTLAFATHGLLAGDFKSLAEPALVLTPPAEGSEVDDGLLTASEVAQLKLNADWVILSACNTAAADGTPGAEGLSGLAKAFFYAGSRALLVSHWAVSSEAAVGLATGTFDELARDPDIGRSEALRRSMLALMNDPERPYLAHPMFWAPFVVVGEGAGDTREFAHTATTSVSR